MTNTTDLLHRAGSLGLGELSALTKPERDHVRQWLTDNFCSEDTFGWELTELADGGLSLEDPSEGGSVDDEFRVHLIDGASGPAFLVVLYQGPPEGRIFDRKTAAPVALVSEGDVIEIEQGYRKAAEQISRLLPGVSPLAVTAAEYATFPPPPGGPANEQEWRARFPEPEAQRTIHLLVEALRKTSSYKGASPHHCYFEDDNDVPYPNQPKDPFEWLCGCKRLPLASCSPFSEFQLAIFSQLKELSLKVDPATDLSPLAALHSLEELSVKGGEESSWEWLAQLVDLRELSISRSDTESSAIHQFNVRGNPKLEKFAWSGDFTDISQLGLGPNLRELSLGGRLEDLTPLRGLDSLEVLSLFGCEVRDITPLLGLKQLWELELRFNRVRSLEGIERMESLGELDVWGNCVTDFSPIHRWLEDEEEAEEWIRLTTPTQLDLSSPAGLAVHEDWFNPDKWEALAAHFDAQGNPQGEHIRECLANGKSDEGWFRSHRLPVRERT